MATRKKALTEKEQMIVGLTKRLKFKKENLAKTKKFHREVERELAGKIKRDQIQLTALKK